MSGTPKPELRAAVLELWRKGLSSSQIAAELGISRNAVIGHVARARKAGVIGLRVPGISEAATRRREERAARVAEARQRLSELFQRHEPKPAPAPAPEAPPTPVAPTPVAPPPPVLPEGPVTVFTVRRGQCRWILPYRHEGFATYCAEAVKPGTSWCPEHHRRVFVPHTPLPKKRPLRRTR